MICTAVNANELFLRTNTEIARGRFFSKLFGSNSAVLRNLILVVIGGFNLLFGNGMSFWLTLFKLEVENSNFESVIKGTPF